MSRALQRVVCRLRGHRWHPLAWATVWGEWAHLWRGPWYGWKDHPSSWGIVGPIDPYGPPQLRVCGRCGELKRANAGGGVLHLKVVGTDAPERPRPVACAGELALGAAPVGHPFRSSGGRA